MSGRDVYRVTVRGRFVDLEPRARARLAAHAAEHDLFSSAFTEEGTLTYDDRLTFFNMRFEVRDGDDEDEAHAIAQARAEEFLGVLGLGVVVDRVTSMNMTRIAARTRR